MLGIRYDPEAVLRGLLSEQSWQLAGPPMEQLSLFDDVKGQPPALRSHPLRARMGHEKEYEQRDNLYVGGSFKSLSL